MQQVTLALMARIARIALVGVPRTRARIHATTHARTHARNFLGLMIGHARIRGLMLGCHRIRARTHARPCMPGFPRMPTVAS